MSTGHTCFACKGPILPSGREGIVHVEYSFLGVTEVRHMCLCSPECLPGAMRRFADKWARIWTKPPSGNGGAS